MKKILEFLSSRRLALYLFFILMGLSLLGAFIPQREIPAFYEAHYQSWAVGVFKTFQLTDLYHSWYFVTLLALLVLSLVVCTVRRVPRLWASFRGRVPARPEELPYQAELGPGNLAAAAAKTPRPAAGFAWRREGSVLYGRRQPYAVSGELLTHLGLVVIFVGAALKLFGHSEMVFAFEGQRVVLPAAFGEGYRLAADKVEEISDPNTGAVLKYRTTARLFRNETFLARKAVEVNAPLLYRGIGIYQSSMNAAGMKGIALEAIKLKAGVTPAAYGAATFVWALDKEVGELAIGPGETKPLGKTGLELRYLDYFERFITDKDGIRDDNPKSNPAAVVSVVRAAEPVVMGIVFREYPDQPFLSYRDEGFAKRGLRLSFRDAKAAPFTESRMEYLLAAGATAPVGGAGGEMRVTMGEGEGEDLTTRALEAWVSRPGRGAKKYAFPYGRRVPVKLGDGYYLFRFLGSKSGRVTGLTVARDPGLWPFYVGCLLLSLGVVAAMLWRYDELVVYARGDRLMLGGRSQKGPRVMAPAFERWTAVIKERLL